MPPFRYPGPICQTKDWYENIEDGTLAQTRSPLPGSIGSAIGERGSKTVRKAIATSASSITNPLMPVMLADAAQSSLGLPLTTVLLEKIPAIWRRQPAPLSGGHDVFIYRGISKSVNQAAQKIIRPGDVEGSGIFSRDIAAARNAIQHHHNFETPALSGPQTGGVVQIKVPSSTWDELVRTSNISERSYPGFHSPQGSVSFTEIRVNSAEAAAIIEALPKEILPP